MHAQMTLSEVRASETHPDQFRIMDRDYGTVCIFVDTVAGYDRIIAEAKKGRDRLAAANLEAVGASA